MKVCEEVFKRYRPSEESLIPYGFTKDESGYSLEKVIHNGDFRLILTIKGNDVSMTLIDTAFDEPYELLNVNEATGGFIAELKEECVKVLLEIRDSCFYKEYFVFPQSNRISQYVYEKYDVLPEFLWEEDPDYGVFRTKAGKKWFGIIMHIKKDRIMKGAEGFVEVINVKTDDETQNLLLKTGIYPAYHMNKKKWVSVALDETLSDNEIRKLIDNSYSSLKKK